MWIVPVVALAHFALTAMVFLKHGSMMMARFDTGADASILERLMRVGQEVLFFPVVTLAYRVPHAANLFPGAAGWIPIVMNSLL